jgi:molecular chaperone GrpE
LSRKPDPEKTELRIDVGGAGAPAAATGPQAAAPAEAAEPEAAGKLSEQLARLQAEKEELRHTLIRRQADFENYRKRIERERREDTDRAVAALAAALLPVIDGFERALSAHQDPAYEDYRQGFELLLRQLQEVLARQGVTRLEVEGKPFDPHWHHAVERIESDAYPDGTVIEQLQPGYKFRDRVLRPAMVRVAIHPASKTAGTESEVN